jgi:hypothetical protein
MTLGLVRGDRPRPATALRCAPDVLARWADTATTARIERLSGAWDGSRILVRGRALPEVPSGERFWGNRLLIPLGFRPGPDLPERALLKALHAGDEELFLLEADGCEVVPLAAFQPLTRAALRLARGVAAP